MFFSNDGCVSSIEKRLIYSFHSSCPKGLHAESARAVTGRQCPHSGEGEDFLTRRPSFFDENGHNSGTKSQKSPTTWEMNLLSEGYKQARDAQPAPAPAKMAPRPGSDG